MIRTRLAPSPTGALHLGNARSFLLAWLWARAQGGEVVLRVEDLDGPRTKAGAVEQALADLAWLGLDWDGEVLLQSTRTEAYDQALARLQAAGRVYPCTCTRKEIEQARSAPNEGDEGPRYPGSCRGRYATGAQAEDEGGRAPAWRFRLEEGARSEFLDTVRGAEEDRPAEREGDFVIAKKSGEAAYQLAVVVDDAHQGITDVIRGDDLVPSTHLQLALYEALGLAAPRFAHLPLVRGEDGRRLAKRHGDTRVAHYRERGVSAERVVGLLAGWSGLGEPGGERAPLSAGDLLARVGSGWSWEGLPREDVVFRAADDAWLREG